MISFRSPSFLFFLRLLAFCFLFLALFFRVAFRQGARAGGPLASYINPSLFLKMSARKCFHLKGKRCENCKMRFGFWGSKLRLTSKLWYNDWNLSTNLNMFLFFPIAFSSQLNFTYFKLSLLNTKWMTKEIFILTLRYSKS